MSDNRHKLPPFSMTSVSMPLSQTLPWSHELLGIPDAWKHARGRGVRVCVLDTGVDTKHNDLKDGLAEAMDFTGSRYGPEDVNSHGTWCCGMIGGRDNEFGTVGVAPDCEIVSGKVLGDEGWGKSQWIVEGIEWADRIGADIISMSLGSDREDPSISAALERFLDREGALRRCVVAAAGNDGNANRDSINWPGAHRRTIAVAAINNAGKIADFSSRGPQVDIAAPGVDLLSTTPGSRYATMSGTSMATPVVAGVVALMMSNGTREGIVGELRDTAIDIGDMGKDLESGHGLINPDDLITSLDDPPELQDNTYSTPFGDIVVRTNILTKDGHSWTGFRRK